MVLAAPEPLIGQIHWTRFPASAIRTVDWTDHHDAHQAVMRMFEPRLGGARGEVRSANRILFRIDIVEDHAVVLVQSAAKPALVPPEARTLVLSGRTWRMEPDDKVRFRVAVNPIARNGRANTERVRHSDEVPAWLADRVSGGLKDLTFFNQSRTDYRSRRNKDLMVVETIDGIAVVEDPDRLDLLRVNGVGRRKAYGCGLLTVQRIG